MHCEQAKQIYYQKMVEEIESILLDDKNYYNYEGIPHLIEHWEKERCSMFLTKMSSRRGKFPRECMYSSALRSALLKRMATL